MPAAAAAGQRAQQVAPVHGSLATVSLPQGSCGYNPVGSLDSTDVTYSTKVQAGRTSLQDIPTLSAKRLSGSDSMSETSSIGPADESSRVESFTGSPNIHPFMSMSPPETAEHAEACIIPPGLHGNPEQVEAEEERQPEGQENGTLVVPPLTMDYWRASAAVRLLIGLRIPEFFALSTSTEGTLQLTRTVSGSAESSLF
ncbi:hypothetical protein CCH79_00015718 [Gambusia affinis]|uniref:Uncharacterized protein n=1 Tax=Gambusia affinis TaxID=33528 RepID=A0A315WFK6_GAMAF|nr:hypothetical protein CCH79_00015718 [Gambusia affinis]